MAVGRLTARHGCLPDVDVPGPDLSDGPIFVRRLDPASDEDAVLRGFDTVLRTVGAQQRGELAPSEPPPASRLRERYVAVDRLRWVALHDRGVSGIAELTSGGPGEPTAFARIYVDPGHRGGGVGRALVTAVARTVSEAGAEMFSSIVLAGTPAADFAFALGAEVGEELVIQVLELPAVDRAALGAIVAAGVPEYELVRWRGAVPEPLVDSYAVAKRFIADAPNVHLPQVPPWDRAMVRASERDRAERGVELWVSAAVVAGSTTLAAFTAVEVGGSPVDALQEDTVVLPAHRRRGLASLVKSDMVLGLRADREELRRVSSTTAASNTGMRAVNARVGFRELARRLLVLVPVSVLLQRLTA
jgi:mycothiol synthase